MKIKIKGREWEVEKVEHIVTDSDAIGQTQNLNRKIYLMQTKDCKDATHETLSTIIHELTHAYLFETGVRNLREHEENLCYWLESCFMDMFANAVTIFGELFGVGFEIEYKKGKKKNGNGSRKNRA